MKKMKKTNLVPEEIFFQLLFLFKFGCSRRGKYKQVIDNMFEVNGPGPESV